MEAFEYYDQPPQYAQVDTSGFSANSGAGRWSKHLANDPYGGKGDWTKKYYDDDTEGFDPNEAIQRDIAAFRAKYGRDAPEDDLSIIEMIGAGVAPTPKGTIDDSNKGGGGGTGGGGGGGDKEPDRRNEFYEELKKRMNPGAVDRNSATVRQQVDPGVAQMDRARRNAISDAAERGGSLGNIEGQRRMITEGFGNSAAELESRVIASIYGDQMDTARQAMGQYGGMLSDDQRIETDRWMAELMDRSRNADRDLARRGQDQSYDEFLRELALREWESYSNDDYRRRGGY